MTVYKYCSIYAEDIVIADIDFCANQQYYLYIRYISMKEIQKRLWMFNVETNICEPCKSHNKWHWNKCKSTNLEFIPLS